MGNLLSEYLCVFKLAAYIRRQNSDCTLENMNKFLHLTQDQAYWLVDEQTLDTAEVLVEKQRQPHRPHRIEQAQT